MVFQACIVAAGCSLALLSANAKSFVPDNASAVSTDPFLWLEEVEGERALGWVRQQNERTLQQLTKDPRYGRYYDAALAIAEDPSRLPLGATRNGQFYNFWQDGTNIRGVWRRATIASYLTGKPEWRTLLDVDRLARSDGRNWVFKGTVCLPPVYRRCMMGLSDGGKDATTYREFDTEKGIFVENGFALPEAKSRFAWKDEDTLLVATNWGAESLTKSGYPFIVKEWRRGHPLARAREIHRGQAQDVSITPTRLQGPGGETLLVISEFDTSLTRTHYTVSKRGRLARIALPPHSSLQALHHDEIVFTIQEDWTIGGRTWRSGSLLSISAADATNHSPTVRSIIEPGPRESIEEIEVTSAGLLVTTYHNVRGRLVSAGFTGGKWHLSPITLPDNGTISLQGTDPNSDLAFVTYQSFLQPTTLYAVDSALRPTYIDALPPHFDASHFVTEQHEVASLDGTTVPYFVVRPKASEIGEAPTLLSAYGGFQRSQLPAYSATIGRLWLEQGGIYVLANIRGGGEFGPAWHQAGLKTKRQVIYDDFISVAEALKRENTTSWRLGIRGGSNGGLLMGVALTQRPELFRAAVIQVPLLDMLRYHTLLAGASWIGEYGSPEIPDERAWLGKISPYHHLHRRNDFPLPFLMTSTNDDRVHPGHARKYAAKLESIGMPFLYYESMNGGHSAAANSQERARRAALEFTYLAQMLRD